MSRGRLGVIPDEINRGYSGSRRAPRCGALERTSEKNGVKFQEYGGSSKEPKEMLLDSGRGVRTGLHMKLKCEEGTYPLE